MTRATLTKRIEFSASHRYHNPAWDSLKNRQVFGPCNHEQGHGHNYLLEVTVRGEVDGVTGMIINLYDLKRVLADVLEEFDHKNLNLDMPYFRTMIPTPENFALVLWDKFSQHPDTRELESLRMFEGEDLCVEIHASFAPGASTDSLSNNHRSEARLLRRYSFSSSHVTPPDQLRGHQFVLWVGLRGPINPDTGRVADIVALDRLVGDQVTSRFTRTDLSQDRAFQNQVFSHEHFTHLIWTILKEAVPSGQLEKVLLRESDGTEVEYSG